MQLPDRLSCGGQLADNCVNSGGSGNSGTRLGMYMYMGLQLTLHCMPLQAIKLEVRGGLGMRWVGLGVLTIHSLSG